MVFLQSQEANWPPSKSDLPDLTTVIVVSEVCGGTLQNFGDVYKQVRSALAVLQTFPAAHSRTTDARRNMEMEPWSNSEALSNE